MTDETPNPAAPQHPTPVRHRAPVQPDAPGPRRALASAETPPRRPDYRGEELDPERGPGLGCFWFQVIVLGFFIVLIPIGLNLDWPFELLAILLFVVLGLLLLTGQTVIFLLRLVAADRRAQGRRRPLASPTRTVGELEDAHRVAHAVGGARQAQAVVPAADATDLPAGAAASAASAAAPLAPAAATPVAAASAATPGAADSAATPAPAAPDDAPADAPPGAAGSADGDFVASRAMIRDGGAPSASVDALPDAESEGESVAAAYVTLADETAGLRAPATGGGASAEDDPEGSGEGQMAARTHESSSGGHGPGLAPAVGAAEPPSAAADADGPAGPAAADPAAAAPPGDPGAGGPPEEPGAGVRQ